MMPFPLSQLVQGADRIVKVEATTLVSEALKLMINNNFTQLPVVDTEGRLVGIISEQDILRTQRIARRVNMLDGLTVDQCYVEATTLELDKDDLYTALDRLERAVAIVVIDGSHVPVGIVTAYDTTSFLRNLTEGLLWARDIEVVLRQYIERAFPGEEAMRQALLQAFGPGRRPERTEPAKQYTKLTMGEHIHLIQCDGNWPVFEPVFQPRMLFTDLMEQARDIRNAIVHLRNSTGRAELDALRRAYRWLSTRPKLPAPHETNIHAMEAISDYQRGVNTLSEPIRNKYEPLRRWLRSLDSSTDEVSITFDEIEAMVGEKLPATAQEHPSWWAYSSDAGGLSDVWLSEGWYVESVEFELVGLVNFRRIPVPSAIEHDRGPIW